MTAHEEGPPIAANDQEAKLEQQAAGELRSTKSISSDREGTTDQPLNWDGAWKQVPILPPKGLKSRQPAIKIPRNLEDATETTLNKSRVYWERDVPTDWSDLTRTIERGYLVGVIPHRSDLVILDCDKDTFRVGDGYELLDSSTIRFVEDEVKHGIDDLRREVEKLDHEWKEIATYSVATRSGGLHLYYRQNPRYPIASTMHHRENWLIDVIAGENGWVAAPPTPGYSVVNDLPVIEMPDWLAMFLLNLTSHLPYKKGGQQRKQARLALHEAFEQAKANGETFDEGDGGLWDLYIKSLLYQVVLGNRYGGWNDAIFKTSLELFKVGYDYDSVASAVLDAAEPVNDFEKKKAEDSIASAFRNFRRNHGGSVS